MNEIDPKKPFPILPRLTDYVDPIAFTSKDHHLVPLFNEIAKHKVSDIFISPEKPILVQKNKLMVAVTERPIGDIEAQFFLTEIGGSSAITIVNRGEAVDKLYSIFDGEKDNKDALGYRKEIGFRVNIFGIILRGAVQYQIVLRLVPTAPPSFDTIGMSQKLVQRSCPVQGIVLTCGNTGDGKSTSQASTIRYILENDTPIKGNIVTIEDPIEFVYHSIISSHSIVSQSQIPENAPTFNAALIAALRRKPAAILVGEMRDKATIDTVITSALTGHPVFSTLHCGSIIDVIPRILKQFENSQQILYDLVSTSTLYINQRLVHFANGKGMFAVREYLYFTYELKRKLLNFKDVSEITNYLLDEMEKAPFDDDDSYISPSYKRQGEYLFEKGIIDEKGLIKLTNQVA